MGLVDLPKDSQAIVAAGTTYSPIIDLSQTDATNVEATLHVTATDGTSFTLDVIPQYSYDKVVWFDQDVLLFAQVTEVTAPGAAESLDMGFTGIYQRFKYVAAGADIDVTFDLYAVGK